MNYPTIRLLCPALAVPSLAPAASLLTLSHPVADLAINTAAGNNIRTDWDGVAAFPTDPDEAKATDFASISMAHDSLRLYVRETLYRTSNSGFFAGNQILFFDTDQSAATGYTGPGGSLSLGAEFLLEGVSLYSFTGGGSQTAFSWSFVGSVLYDDFPLNDHELTIPLANLGTPAAFDFIALTDYFGNGDNYPDNGYNASGGSYTYTTVPEPGAAALLAFTGLCLRRRTRAAR